MLVVCLGRRRQARRYVISNLILDLLLLGVRPRNAARRCTIFLPVAGSSTAGEPGPRLASL